MAASGELLGVCRVAELHPDDGLVGVTAVDKRAVDGPVGVYDLGLWGDVQADRADHGGPDKALYAYDDAEAAHWARELGQDVWLGRFGENLRTRGLDVDGAEIGERWRIGSDVVVEVTMPRTPCRTFGRWLGQERWVRRFADHGRPGAYLRVVARGEVCAGDRVEVVHRPGHGVGVAAWFAEPTPAAARALLDAREDAGLDLAPTMVAMAEVVVTRD